MRFDAVLFDLDGTLLDTLADLADSMNAALTQMHLPTHPQVAYKEFVGDGMPMLARRVLPERERSEARIAEAIAAMTREYDRRWNRSSWPYDGVGELLDAIDGYGLAKGVLSNKPHAFVLQCVAQMLGEWHFDFVQGVAEDCPSKPNPQGALAIAERLGVRPERVCYVGDSNIDMRTATAAGMYAVGACWGFRSAEELRDSGAQELITRPMELMPILTGDE